MRDTVVVLEIPRHCALPRGRGEIISDRIIVLMRTRSKSIEEQELTSRIPKERRHTREFAYASIQTIAVRLNSSNNSRSSQAKNESEASRQDRRPMTDDLGTR